MKSKLLVSLAIFIALVTTAATVPPSTELPAKKIAGRPVPVFDFVHGHRSGKGATIMWATSESPAYVVSFTVIRTYEDPLDPYAEWTVVDNQMCTSSKTYKSTEANVAPGFISYRVVASMVGGGIIYSDVVTIHVVQH